MTEEEKDDGFNPVEGETVTAMIARLRADPAVMAIYNERQEGAKEAQNNPAKMPQQKHLDNTRDT